MQKVSGREAARNVRGNENLDDYLCENLKSYKGGGVCEIFCGGGGTFTKNLFLRSV
jgi:hypothetical protein